MAKAPSVTGGALKNIPVRKTLSADEAPKSPAQAEEKCTCNPFYSPQAFADELERVLNRDRCDCQPNNSFVNNQ